MRRLGLILGLVIGLLVALVPAAGAHPLGNFTVNTQLRVEASGDQLYLRHVVDMAEIPTLRERGRVDAAGGAEAYAAAVAPERARAVEVTVDGRRRDVRPLSQTAELLPGQGGLDVLRYAAWYRVEGVGAGGEVAVADRNLADRQGWRDILVRPSSGAAVSGADAVGDDLTDELRHYPDGALASPHRTESVTFGWTPGDGPGEVASATGDPASPGAARDDSGLSGLASSDLTTGAIVLSILLAMGWGALHSLSPGHGKTMVAAYLVGTRGRTRHALLLGVFVTVTHTVGVVALGLVTLLASRYILPEDLFSWINLVAALMVVAVGWWALRGRLRPLRARWAHARAHRRGLAHAHAPSDHGAPVLVAAAAHVHAPGHHHAHAGHHHEHHGHAGHHHDHDHAHGHDHGPGGHTHAPPEELSLRSLLAVGASAGLVPCPSALVLLLGAIALERVGYGLVLVVAFSLGLAGLLSLIGILVLHARRLIDRVPLDGRLAGAVPAASALVIVALGVFLTARALPPLL